MAEIAYNRVGSLLSCDILIRLETADYEQRWYAVPDNQKSAQQLREAIVETLVEPSEQNQQEQVNTSRYDQMRIRINSIHRRLQEINDVLRREGREG